VSQFQLISADSHVIEPGNLWENYVDPRYRDRAPHLVHDEEEDRFVIDGRATGSLGLMGGAGRAPDDITSTGRFEVDVPRAAWDPQVRLEAVQRDGVEAEVLYPTICLSIFGNRDLGFVSACMDAYNRWLMDFCSVAPTRFKGVGLIVMNDIEMACAQLERVRELGLSGVMVPLRPQTDVSYSSDRYDPVWERAEALELPLTMHIFTEPQSAPSRDLAQAFAEWVTKPANIQRTVAEMIFSGVFERFPGLRIVSAENDVGWIAHFLERMDHRLTRKRYAMYHDPTLSLMPSEYFRRNVLATFMDDPAGVATRDLAGVDNLMWSSDYPHHESTWPDSRQVIKSLFDDVPAAERRRILAENAATLYHFD
jgi:predicted TIM-barrel fold metal-dependent hydrolase